MFEFECKCRNPERKIGFLTKLHPKTEKISNNYIELRSSTEQSSIFFFLGLFYTITLYPIFIFNYNKVISFVLFVPYGLIFLFCMFGFFKLVQLINKDRTNKLARFLVNESLLTNEILSDQEIYDYIDKEWDKFFNYQCHICSLNI